MSMSPKLGAKITSKTIGIDDFGVYLDVNTRQVSLGDDFAVEMANLISDGHEYLIVPMKFQFDMEIETGSERQGLGLHISLPDVVMSLSERQLGIITKVSLGMAIFARKYAIRQIKRPNPDDDLDLWRFVHESAKSQSTGPRALWRQFAKLAIAKTVYLNNLKTKRSPEVVALDHELDYQYVLFFHSLMDQMKGPRAVPKMAEKMYDKALGWVDFSPIVMISSTLVDVRMNTELKNMLATYWNAKKYAYLQVRIDTIIMNLCALKDGTRDLTLKISPDKIVSGTSHETFTILEVHKGASISVNSKALSHGQAVTVGVSIVDTDCTIDIPHILTFLSQLDLDDFTGMMTDIRRDRSSYSSTLELGQLQLKWVLDEESSIRTGCGSLKFKSEQVGEEMQSNLDINNIFFGYCPLPGCYHEMAKGIDITTVITDSNVAVNVPAILLQFNGGDMGLLTKAKPLFSSAETLRLSYSARRPDITVNVKSISIYSDLVPSKIVVLSFLTAYLVLNEPFSVKLELPSFIVSDILDVTKCELSVAKEAVSIFVDTVKCDMLEGLVTAEKFKCPERPNPVSTELHAFNFNLNSLQLKYGGATASFAGIKLASEEKTIHFEVGAISSSDATIESLEKSISGSFSLEKKLLTVNVELKSMMIDMDNLLAKMTFRKFEIPKSEETFNLKIQSKPFPIRVNYGGNVIEAGVGLSGDFHFAPDSLNIKLRHGFFRMNTAEMVSHFSVAIYRDSSSKLTIALKQTDVHLSIPLIERLISMFKMPSITKYNPVDVLCAFDIVAPKLEINLHSQSSEKLGKKLFLLPLTNLVIHSSEHRLRFASTFSISSVISPLQNETIMAESEFRGKSRIDRSHISSQMTVASPFELVFSPRSLRSLVDFKRDCYASSGFLFVNETGMKLGFIVDEQKFQVMNQSSYIAWQFPKNPLIKIQFLQYGQEIDFNLSLLRRQDGYPILVCSGYILIRLTSDAIIFSSILRFENRTSMDLLLEIPHMGRVNLLAHDTYIVLPEFAMIRSFQVCHCDCDEWIDLTLKKQSVQLGERYFHTLLVRDPVSLVATFQFLPPFTITSLFPFPIMLYLDSRKKVPPVDLFPNMTRSIDYFPQNVQSVSVLLSGLDKHSLSKALIPLREPFAIIEAVSSRRVHTYFKCFVSSGEVKIAAPLLVQNEIGKEIFVISGNKTKVSDKEVVSLTNLSGDSYRLSFALGKDYPPSDEVVICAAASTSECDLKLPNNAVTPIVVVTKLKMETLITHLRPLYRVVNATESSLIGVSNGHQFEIGAGESTNIEEIDTTHVIRFRIHESTITVDLNSFDSFSCLTKVHRKLLFDRSISKHTRILTISEASDKVPTYSLVNETTQYISFFQRGYEEHPFFVEPLCTLMFDLPDSRSQWYIDILPYEICLDLRAPKRYDYENGIYCSVIMGPHGRNRIVLCEGMYQSKTEKYDQSLAFAVPSASIRLLTDLHYEMLHLTVRNLMINGIIQGDENQFDFGIGSFQIDDMNASAEYPVVLYGSSCESKPFFSLSYCQFAPDNIAYLIANIQPLIANIDLSLVSDVHHLISMLDLKTIENGSGSTSDRVFCQLLRFGEVSGDVTFRSKTCRIQSVFYPFRYPSIIHLIPSIESLRFSLRELEKTCICGSPVYLAKLIGREYVYDAAKQWYTIPGSSALFGSPQRLIRNVRDGWSSLFTPQGKDTVVEEAKVRTGKFASLAVGGVMMSSETAMKAVARNLRSITGDVVTGMDDRTASGAVSQGWGSFKQSLSNVVSGILVRPVESAREDGIAGLVKGAALGYVGIWTNTISGSLDFGAGVLGGVRRGVFGEDALKRVVEPSSPKVDGEKLVYADPNVQVYTTMVQCDTGKMSLKELNFHVSDDSVVTVADMSQRELMHMRFKNQEKAMEFYDSMIMQKERLHVQEFFDFLYEEQET